RLRLRVRRFFCGKVACARRVFAERPATVVAPYARRTVRLDAWLRHVTFALGGRPGARLLHDLGLGGGRDALLARVLATPAAPRPAAVLRATAAGPRDDAVFPSPRLGLPKPRRAPAEPWPRANDAP